MDVEKTIEFILQQQAASEARWADLDARFSAQMQENAARHREIDTLFVKLGNNQKAIQETQFRQLEMINGRMDTSFRHEGLFKEIGERLNALISVVDGLVRRNN